jgi:thioredoxin 1
MKSLTYDEFENTIKSFVPVLVEFWSPVCTVCEKAEVYLRKLEQVYQNKITITRINIDSATQLIDIYSIRKLPTFVIFKNSIELARVVGFKNEIELEREVRKHIK